MSAKTNHCVVITQRDSSFPNRYVFGAFDEDTARCTAAVLRKMYPSYDVSIMNLYNSFGSVGGASNIYLRERESGRINPEPIAPMDALAYMRHTPEKYELVNVKP